MTKQAYDKISGGLKEALELAKAPSMSQFDLATVEALADAWASIDGKQAEFRSGKSAKVVLDEHGGYYSGYLADLRHYR